MTWLIGIVKKYVTIIIMLVDLMIFDLNLNFSVTLIAGTILRDESIIFCNYMYNSEWIQKKRSLLLKTIEDGQQRGIDSQPMKILAVSDKIEQRFLQSGHSAFLGEEIELILACGDLQPTYLEFLVNILNVPLFYVLGNHDVELHGKHINGCTCLDETTLYYKDRIFGGLSGSIKYSDGPLMYTEMQMHRKVARMFPRLIFNRLRHGKYIDILLTHSPVYGLLDEPTRAHQGFKTLRMFDKQFHPQYHLHGHSMVTGDSYKATYRNTTIVNVNHYRILDI